MTRAASLSRSTRSLCGGGGGSAPFCDCDSTIEAADVACGTGATSRAKREPCFAACASNISIELHTGDRKRKNES